MAAGRQASTRFLFLPTFDISSESSAHRPRFGLIDFKVLLLEKPGGAPRPAYQNASGYRWYSQK
ncbi:MAG: hypothetical protein AB7G48_17860 [Nitrospiraceae bacterium]